MLVEPFDVHILKASWLNVYPGFLWHIVEYSCRFQGSRWGRVIDLLSLFSVGACGVFVKCGTTWRQCMHVWQVWEQCNNVPISRYSCHLMQFGVSEQCITGNFHGCSTCDDGWCCLLVGWVGWDYETIGGIQSLLAWGFLFILWLHSVWIPVPLCCFLFLLDVVVAAERNGYLVPGTRYPYIRTS